MSYAADQWRSLYNRANDAYTMSPGGEPPATLIEALVNLESGGNPYEISGAGAVGLGQIMKGGMEYGGYESVFGPVSSPLTDPATNVSIIAYGLNLRQEMYGTNAPPMHDWFLAGVGWFGGLTPQGEISTAVDPWTGFTARRYYDTLVEYVRTKFGNTEVTKLKGGSGSDTDATNDQLEDPTSGTTATTAKNDIQSGAMRVGIFAVGIAMLVVAAFMVKRV